MVVSHILQNLTKYLWLPVVFSVFFFSACATVEEGSATDPTDSLEFNRGQLQSEPYTIGVDDQINISVWGNPELTLDMPVRPDGKISMPLVGDIQAGGLTPEQVAKDIKRKLSRYIKNPNVTVILTELRSHTYISRIRVTGAVQAPVSIPYRQGMTLLDAVLEAGGLNEFAAPGRTKLYREYKGKTRVYEIDLDAIINDGDLSTNKKLVPGDIVAVPERFL